MTPTTYTAERGRVMAHRDGRKQEAATALSADGRDLERHDRALQEARRQRERGEGLFPLEWNAWRAAWTAWTAAHADDLRPTSERFPGKNFLANEILGTWLIRGTVTELAEVTFPNLEERDLDTGRLLDHSVRGIGITRGVGPDTRDDDTVVHSFAELETALGIGERRDV